MRYIYRFFFVSFLLNSAYTAAPLTHLYLGDVFLKHYHVEDRKAFLLGNIYPDIRYMSKISRTKTHKKNVTLEEIIHEKDSFKKGCLLHSYVDVLRESIVEKLHIYDMIHPYDRGYKSKLLKFVEDEYLFQRCSTAEYVQMNAVPIIQEFQHNLQLLDLRKWHFYISGYLTIRPSTQMYLLSMATKEIFGIPSHIIFNWSSEIPILASDPYLIKYTKYMLDRIEKSFIPRKRIYVLIRLDETDY